MNLRTALYAQHLTLHAHMVPFGGWEMPLHYGSQLEEHHATRRNAGLFDVSHMAVVDVTGADSQAFLRYLLANDVARLMQPGKALYSCMLNADGGVLDDLIVYAMINGEFRIVINAATAKTDLTWMRTRAEGFNASLIRRTDLALLALQGPQAVTRLLPLLPTVLQSQVTVLKPFNAIAWNHWFIARTGYTGEDGVEIALPNSQASELWQALLNAGASPCGLGARDTLRLEAGMNLYGTDMDENSSPLECGLAWTVAWEPAARNFIGRTALERQRAQNRHVRQVGLLLESRGVLRNHYPVFAANTRIGEITSGGFAPTLNRSIALARISGAIDAACSVEIRGQRLPVRIVKPPFVRHGQALI